MSLRIVAGTRGGRRITAPPGRNTRPTSDRVREALFSILGAGALEGARVLDLFAGSGALGIEALSRGAAEATFVDSDGRAVAAIERNLAQLGLSGRVHRRDALAWLAERILDGEIALGVIDLDTGASHGVHVAPPVVSDIGGEGAAAVPWEDAPTLPAVDPGRASTSTTARRTGAHRSP